MARAAGVHGVYVVNALAAAEGEVVLLQGSDGLLGLCWFGPRGNLIVVEAEPLEPAAVAAAVRRSRWPWRIALGPNGAIDGLARELSVPPLVLRDQVYYGARPEEAAAGLQRADVRLPVRADRDRLMLATLLLNDADLHVDPARVDRRWLRATVTARIAEGSTRVLGPEGALLSKLDLGSRGPAGEMVEGVFTFPEARGRGLAAGLVATVLHRSAARFLCLHVAADNRPARGAYEAAGLRERGACRLLLVG